MARAICMALAFAALASGARYGDYSGAKMPEYSGVIDYEMPREPPAAPSDEYRDHLPEYEETGASEKSFVKNVDGSEEWLKPIKKHRKHSKSLDDSFESLPNMRWNHRFSEYRPRKHKTILDDAGYRASVRYGRYRKEDSGTKNKNVEEEDFKGHQINNRASTARTARRKQRDKIGKSNSNDDSLAEDDFEFRRPDSCLTEDEMAVRPLIKPAQDLEMSASPGTDQEELESRRLRNHNKYDDNFDYYDMKRVQNIKDKLPVLFRRPTKQEKVNCKRKTPTTCKWQHRRPMDLNINEDINAIVFDPGTTVGSYKQRSTLMYVEFRRTSTASDCAERVTELDGGEDGPQLQHINLGTLQSRTGWLEHKHRKVASRIVSATKQRRRAVTSPEAYILQKYSTRRYARARPIPSDALLVIPLPSTGSHTTVLTSSTAADSLSVYKNLHRTNINKEINYHTHENPTPMDEIKTQNMTLSISNQAQLYASIKGGRKNLHRAKPPSNMHSAEANQEEIHDLKKVKRLMRNRLIVNAKNIYDLSDNWEEMVCDYIDTRLLRSAATIKVNTFVHVLSIIFIILSVV